MSILEYRYDREIIIGTQTIFPELIEYNLFAYPNIIDCRVLAKECHESGRQLVAYIVLDAEFIANDLRQYLKSCLPNSILPEAYIAITNMPLTESGQIDDKQLLPLVVVNKQLLESWSHELEDTPELLDYSVLAQYKDYQCEPLHLSHLCPVWKTEMSQEDIDDIDYEEGEKTDVIALSEGELLLTNESHLPMTLSEGLFAAQKHSDSGIIFVQQDGSDVFQSYNELLIKAKTVVSGLQKEGLKANDVVILQLATLEDFFPVFWGCILAGVTPLTVAIAPTYESKNGVLEKLYNAALLLKQPPIIYSEQLADLNEEEQLELFLNHAQLASRLLPDTSIEQLRHYLTMFKANQSAMFTYQTKRYQGDILYFRALSRDELNPANPESSWMQLAMNDFELIDVVGNHLTMMQAPNVELIAKRLQDIINNID
ncbi:non-ribosomal peptide synthetase [sulfur-oxidizing endosymbiont of Gigantopelta aegis]|uniref:non-ribosomal peptide synthetase n=1 Tax=sulfur-oxidizing endosymbiont of Gigantopelta aegis TaxID=2794934 RepID=UPI0018DC345B|nr:hypothetical protein [sulfur-oxidizing endosymbiont of Gigantopelta aegis]